VTHPEVPPDFKPPSNWPTWPPNLSWAEFAQVVAASFLTGVVIGATGGPALDQAVGDQTTGEAVGAASSVLVGALGGAG
jgi:hypothetical protein